MYSVRFYSTWVTGKPNENVWWLLDVLVNVRRTFQGYFIKNILD